MKLWLKSFGMAVMIIATLVLLIIGFAVIPLFGIIFLGLAAVAFSTAAIHDEMKRRKR